MREITFIHTVPMIIDKLNKAVRDKSNSISIENIMDDRILKLVNKDEEKALKRLNTLIKIAKDSNDSSKEKEIVITCSSLSELSKKTESKVVMIDKFLHKEASQYNKLLLVATAETAILPTKNGILKYSGAANTTIDELFIEGAISEFKKGNKKIHDEMILSKIKDILRDERYEALVLCQASMAHLKEDIELQTKVEVLTNIDYFIKNYI